LKFLKKKFENMAQICSPGWRPWCYWGSPNIWIW